jgi:phosphoadenosine phosphosulfate reductase
MSGNTKIETAIKRIKAFEPIDGYYLAFSGGKDSVVIKTLADMSGVKYDAHYNITTVDPPDLIYFIRQQHPDVVFNKPFETMWELIPQKLMPPTRMVRYCCQSLKEGGGEGRFVITGVRWAESFNRKNRRHGIEIVKGNKDHLLFDPDDPTNERMMRICPTKGKRILNPIIDWSNEEVWEFINQYKIPYCKLYDEGFKRLGCIGCPMSGSRGMKRDFERWPKFRALYLRAFDKMLLERCKKGLETEWKSADDVMEWWIG